MLHRKKERRRYLRRFEDIAKRTVLESATGIIVIRDYLVRLVEKVMRLQYPLPLRHIPTNTTKTRASHQETSEPTARIFKEERIRGRQTGREERRVGCGDRRESPALSPLYSYSSPTSPYTQLKNKTLAEPLKNMIRSTGSTPCKKGEGVGVRKKSGGSFPLQGPPGNVPLRPHPRTVGLGHVGLGNEEAYRPKLILYSTQI